MRTLAIIPARYGSSRFPGKPLADIAGKCMIQRVYEQTKKAFDYVCVATDDQRIFDKVTEFGGVAIMTSAQHQSGTDRCYEAYTIFHKQHPEIEIDLIINVQGDEPLIDPRQLKSLEAAFGEKDVYLATMSKRISSEEELFNPNTPKLITDKRGYAIYFSRSTIPYLRGCPQGEWGDNFPYHKHIGLYAYKPEILSEICRMERSSLEIAESLEQLRWIENGLKIKVVETDCTNFAVDTPEDLLKIVQHIKKDSYICA